MKPGRMDRHITVQQLTADSPAQDSYGTPSESWGTYKKMWAEKRDTGGTESYMGKALQAEITTVWRVWYDSGITHKMRIYYNDEGYDIVAINELGRKEGLEIMTTKLTD